MRKNIKVLSLFISIAVAMTGCGTTIPDLSEEQSALIAEYAAGLLLNCDKNYNSRLVDTVEVEKEMAIEAERLEKVANAIKEREKGKSTEEDAEDTSEKKEVVAYQDIASFLQRNDISIQYKGFEVADTYPNDETELDFALKATQDNKLIVLKFDVTNVLSEDIEVDMISENLNFRVSLSDGTTKPTMTTMLMDELSTFRETLSAGETKKATLIIEVPKEGSESLQITGVVIRNSQTSANVDLNQ